MELKKHISPHGTVTAVSMMKDEAPYLLEWVAHHLALGFTDILVYTNDCTDGTDEMLIRLEELGLAHHRRNTIPEGIKPQPSAIKHAQKDPIVINSDWVILFDADEFLSIKYGDGTVDSLISAAGTADGIVITWRTFGSGNVVDWSRVPVTEQYTRAAPALWNKGWGVKTLFKFDAEKWKLGIHRPTMKRKVLETDYPASIHWLNGSGLPMEDYFKFRGWRSIRRTVGYDWVQMNHYAVKSIDAYAVRKFRGNVNNKKDKYNSDYWSLMDRNESEDTSILRHAPKRAAIMTELLKDPVLSKLHTAALERVEARLEDYRKTDAYAELKASLIAASQVPITQVSAKPPKARDPAKIAALMSDVERTTTDKAKAERRANPPENPHPEGPYITGRIDRSTDVAFESVANHGITLPADPRVFVPDTLELVASGKFDRRNARHILQILKEGERVLCLGAGIGFIPILAAHNLPKATFLAQENRPELAEIAREIADAHDLPTSRVKITDGPLTFATDTEDQASGLAALLRDFKPNVLRIGASDLRPAQLAAQDLSGLNRIAIAADTGLDSTAFAQAAAAQQFTISDAYAKTGSCVLTRA